MQEVQQVRDQLKTSREEMQSVNEEMNSVNRDLVAKVKELARAEVRAMQVQATYKTSAN